MYIMNETTTPGEIWSERMDLEPYHTSKPIEIAEIISTTGKKIE
jgi:hypothetical protein